MNLVLVCIHQFQEYILDNLRQLSLLRISNIYVITNRRFFHHFLPTKTLIHLIAVEDLTDEYQYFDKSTLDHAFRGGFWTLTSLRFFYLYALMKKMNLVDCIHIENDVLLYYDIQCLSDKLDRKYIYIPFDTFRRNIASIMFIPSHDVIKIALDNYNFSKNDMDNFSTIREKIGIIQPFPIFVSSLAKNGEERFVCQNYEAFSMIFDAAAMGQYLGGVDPRNIAGDTRGFVNETCVIKYNSYLFEWKEGKPFLIIQGTHRIPIFNLHIHSKNLAEFIHKK